MVVVFIIGLLSAVVLINVTGAMSQGRTTKAITDITRLSGALQSYNGDMFAFPTEQQGLVSLVSIPDNAPGGNRYRPGGYIQKLHNDPWGHPYIYEVPGDDGRPYDFFSLGADGREGGEEDNADISIWDV
jgi:general secretion pathway protein G